MTFIGIAIFTVYTTGHGFSLDAQCVKQAAHCNDNAHAVTLEIGELHPLYVGEFGSQEKCEAALKDVRWDAKDGERVDKWHESLCVPKEHRLI